MCDGSSLKFAITESSTWAIGLSVEDNLTET